MFLGNIEPASKCSLLEERTEVIIAPKDRKPEWKPKKKPKKDAKKKTELNGQDLSTKTGSKSHETAKDSDTSMDHQKSNVNDLNNSEKSADKSSNSSSIPSVTDDRGLLTKTFDYLRSWLNTSNPDQSTELKVEPVVSYLNCSQPCSLRVQHLGEIINTKPESDQQDLSTVLSNQATNLLISLKTVQEAFGVENVPSCFVACISRLPSPKEKEDLMKQRMERQNKAKLANKTSDDIKELEEDAMVTRFPVRVVVSQGKRFVANNTALKTDSQKSDPLNFDPLISDGPTPDPLNLDTLNSDSQNADNLNTKLEESDSEVALSKDENEKEKEETKLDDLRLWEDHGVVSGHIAMNDLLRKQLGIELKGRVKLEAYPDTCKRAEFREIEVHPLFEMVSC